MANSEIKVLAQQPVKVNLAGIVLDIHPPTAYRLHEIDEAGKRYREKVAEQKDVSGLPLDYEICKLMCKTRIEVNGRMVDGEVPEALRDDEFWSKQVQTAEIGKLYEIFIDLTDITKLLKNVLALVGK